MASDAKAIGVALGGISGSNQTAVTGTVTTTAVTTALATDVSATITLLNEIRSALINADIITGSS